jgi:hypothetical protein
MRIGLDKLQLDEHCFIEVKINLAPVLIPLRRWALFNYLGGEARAEDLIPGPGQIS